MGVVWFTQEVDTRGVGCISPYHRRLILEIIRWKRGEGEAQRGRMLCRPRASLIIEFKKQGESTKQAASERLVGISLWLRGKWLRQSGDLLERRRIGKLQSGQDPACE
jgi:hypothetical protein